MNLFAGRIAALCASTTRPMGTLDMGGRIGEMVHELGADALGVPDGAAAGSEAQDWGGNTAFSGRSAWNK